MELNLSPKQKQLLRKTRFIPKVYDEFGKTDRDIIDELCSLDLIKNEIGFLFITEKGKAYLSSTRYKVLTDWVPIVLSSVSIVLSIIAICLST